MTGKHMVLEEDDPFMRLGDLHFIAREKLGTLASAIELHGVFTWDRFGRFTHYSLGSPEVTKALDELAMLYERNGGHPDDEIDHDFYYENFGDRFGWPASISPDFDAIEAGMPFPQRDAPTKKLNVKAENANLGMVLALLKFIQGELDNQKHPDYVSETQLGEFLEKSMVGFPGVSVDNFKKKFARAKDMIPKHEL